MPSPTVAAIAVSTERAAAGVDFSPRYGAICPWCGKKTKVYSTQPWEGSLRVRYHRCVSISCPLHRLKVSIKSVQAEK